LRLGIFRLDHCSIQEWWWKGEVGCPIGRTKAVEFVYWARVQVVDIGYAVNISGRCSMITGMIELGGTSS